MGVFGKVTTPAFGGGTGKWDEDRVEGGGQAERNKGHLLLTKKAFVLACEALRFCTVLGHSLEP